MGVQSYTLSLSTAETNLEVEKRENSVIALEGEAAKKYNYNASPESNIMFELMQDHDMKESVVFAKMAQAEMIKTGGRKDMGVSSIPTLCEISELTSQLLLWLIFSLIQQ